MSYPPRRTRHCMKTEIEIGDREQLVEVEFSYYPGAPARFTPWPGDPPEPSDVEFISAVASDDGKTWRTLTDAEAEAVDAWWWKSGEDRAAEHAAEARYV